eukprot:sb/3463822/
MRRSCELPFFGKRYCHPYICNIRGDFEVKEKHKTRVDDVFIATYQKSGTTWLQHILNQLYDQPQGPDVPNINEAVPWLEEVPQAHVDAMKSPRILKTHDQWGWIPKGEGVRYIFCYRNPKDVVCSYYNHMARVFIGHYCYTGTLDRFYKEVFSKPGISENGDYFDHLTGWMEQRHREDILFVTYEAMVKKVEKELKTRSEELIKTQRDLVAAQEELIKMQRQLLEKRETEIAAVQTTTQEEMKSFVVKKECATALAPKKINYPLRYIFCYRNPKDVVCSYYNHMARVFIGHYCYTGTLDRFYKEVFSKPGISENGDYFDHLTGWLEQQHRENILFVTYEAMVEDLEREIKRIVGFLGLDCPADKISRITSSSMFSSMAVNPYVNYTWRDGSIKAAGSKFIRKGKVGSWKEELNEEYSKELDIEWEKRIGSVFVVQCSSCYWINTHRSLSYATIFTVTPGKLPKDGSGFVGRSHNPGGLSVSLPPKGLRYSLTDKNHLIHAHIWWCDSRDIPIYGVITIDTCIYG